MRKLATAAAVSLSLVTVPGSIQAVSLGDIEMYSTLNQPLDAEVGILAVQRSELRDLVVNGKPVGNFGDGASAAPPSLASMRFNVIQRSDGTPAIRITSDAPVIEPFLNFMLSIDTADGERMVREYTVLLDPPVFGLAPADLNDELLPAGNSVDTDGSAVIQRKPDVRIPTQGVMVDFSDELVPRATGQLPADLRAADRVDVTIAEVSGEPPVTSVSRQYDSIETATVIASQAPDTLPDSDVQATDGTEIELVPGMFESTEKAFQEIDLTELGIARDDSWYSSAEELDLVEPIVRDDSWYKTAVDVELTPRMFGLDGPPRSIETVSVVRAEPQQSTELVEPQINTTPVLPEQEINLQLALQTEFDYSRDGVPVSLDEIAASLGRRVIGNFDSEVNLYERSREPLERTEIPAVATAELVPGGDATVAEAEQASPAAELQLDTSDSDADGGEPIGERIDIEKELPAFEARKKELENRARAPASYQVKDSDTLWSIAENNRADGVSTQQMMVALLRANREAFIDRDMNRLRNGAILRIPEQSSAASIDQAEALSVVREQMSLWQKYRGTTPVTSVSRPLETQPDSAVVEPKQAQEPESTPQPEPAVEQQPTEVDPQDRLTIVGVDGSAQDAEDAGLADGGTPESTEDSVAAQLAAEQAIAEKLEAEEQLAREQELAAIEAGKQRLITLQEEQLAALQEQTSTATETASEAVETTTDSVEPASQAQSEAEATTPSQQTQTLVEVTDADSTTNNSESSPMLAKRLEALAAESDARENALVAEAQSRSERLAGEADAIEAQLVALQSEKQALREIGDLDKVALVAEAEQEKARLLRGAKAEQERIATELEVQRQAVKDDLQRQQLELRANPDALLAQVESENTDSSEATPSVEQTVEIADPDVQSEGAAVNSAGENVFDATDSDADGVVEADSTQGLVETNAQVPAASETAAPETGLTATLQKTLGDRKTLLGAGAGLALLGLLGAWLLRRRKPQPVVVAEQRVEPDFDDQHVEPAVGAGQQGRVQADSQPAPSAVAVAASAKSPEAMDETLAHDDTVSEADVYLAYGLYGQAEDLLTAAIDRSPDDPDYQMKLIETHFVQRDREKFQIAAARFQDRFDDSDARDRIDQMAGELENPAAPGPAETAPSGVIDALAGQAKPAAIDVPPVVQDALDAEADAANQSVIPLAAVASATPDSAGNDDLHGLEALLGDKPEPDDAQLAEIAAGEIEQAESLLDQTIDPGAEFEMSELEATGDFGSIEAVSLPADEAGAGLDIADATLDEVDLSALDDDGTLNLDGIAGDTMSDLDLENMDLTQQGLDATLDNLTLDDADLDLAGSAEDAADESNVGVGSDMGTMLDLAKAYLDMGDNDSAISALREIAEGGTAEQREEARTLLNNLG